MTNPDWTTGFEVGDPDIDNHHQELFHLTSLLDTAIREQSVDKLDQIILFLEDYVVRHFQEEEDLMKSHDYAHYSDHHDEHEVFRVHVSELRRLYKEGPSKAHLIFAIRKLLDKLVHHIRTVDIGISAIVNSK
ncbi:hypothetical protein EBR96_03765 [bacterium]|nr:hypothetical protein [bacterium]